MCAVRKWTRAPKFSPLQESFKGIADLKKLTMIVLLLSQCNDGGVIIIKERGDAK
jgi:hypothetical protein